MATNHVAERGVTSCIEGSLRFGSDQGILVAADLSSLAAAKAAVDADNAKLHVSERHFGAKVKPALDRIDSFVSGITTGTNLTNAYAITDGENRGRSCAF